MVLKYKVLLTKDNLAKRQWNGCKKCCFYDFIETIDHLFLACPFARIVWRMIFYTYNLPPPTNITNMFGNWLNGIDKKTKARIRIGVSALCWSIWTCRNDIVFNKSKGTNFLQVIRLATHWIHLWSNLQTSEQQELMDAGCSRLLKVAQEFYYLAIGSHRIRIQDV